MSGDRFVTEETPGNSKVRTKPCWICGQYSYLTVPHEAWRMFDHLEIPLDIAWPEGSAADKQLILTGVHPACWTAEYPEDKPKE